MVESWHHCSTLMAVNTESFLSQPTHLLLQLMAFSLNRTSLRLIPHDMASPEMSACDPSLNSVSASSIWSGIAFFPSCFPLPSGLPAQWSLSAGSDISSRHICWKLLSGTAEWKMKHFLWLLSFFASDPWSEPAVNHTFFTRSCSLTAYSDNFTGEFGSVREALLKLDDGSFQKVAVKMLKGMWKQGCLNCLRKESLERLNVVCPILSKYPWCSLFLSELPTQPFYPCCLPSFSC